MPHDSALARNLLPTLIDACDGRLSRVSWFRADWQRGGAATGYGTWTTSTGTSLDVVVKFPVGPRELFWTRRLQTPSGSSPECTPQLLASGISLGTYDLAWMVMERLPHGPLGLRWHADHIPRIAEAAARFHWETRELPVKDDQPVVEDWDDLLARARAALRNNRIPHAARWTASIRTIQDALDTLVTRWRGRDATHWIHGDLHLANAMSRHAVQSGPVVLIDLAEVRPGHWAEDAVYLERQLWGRPDRLEDVKPVRAMARARRALGLPVEDEAHELADIRRVLMAASAPAFLRTEGHPRHLEGAHAQLEAAWGRLSAAL